MPIAAKATPANQDGNCWSNSSGTTADDYFADEGDPRLEKARKSPEEMASST